MEHFDGLPAREIPDKSKEKRTRGDGVHILEHTQQQQGIKASQQFLMSPRTLQFGNPFGLPSPL
jgi:hypothetical protein